MTKLLKATHVGEINIGNKILSCAVLENGVRVIKQSAFLTAIGRSRSPKAGTGVLSTVDDLPFFLQAKALQPFIPNDLKESTSPIFYEGANGKEEVGYDAILLPKVAEVYLDYRDNELKEKGSISNQYAHIVAASDTLVRGLAHVGIIGLVDEATGYQEVRDKRALQEILDKYLQDKARVWAKTFPDEFWVKLIKVKGYPSYMALKRPSFVGHWVNDIVYDRIQPGIRKKLNELNPRIEETGRRKKTHTQHFTKDYGLPELKDHLKGVMLLMDAAGGSEVQFNRMLNRALPKYGDTIEMPLDGEA